jgi:dTDP-4-amino-4,6-dideoxy-D-galactose acyltransferase
MTLLTLTRPDLKKVQSELSTNLPWSPYDYIRGLSVEHDREMYAAYLCREIGVDDDMRFICELTDNQRAIVFAERLPWDSQFFGYEVGKVNGVFLLDPPFYDTHLDYTKAVYELLDIARTSRIKYLFAMVNTRDLGLIRSLCQMGFTLIETRSFYHINLKSYEHQRFPCRRATAEDVDILGKVAQSVINPYDRFHADPFVSPEDAARLMYKWVEASIMDKFADVTIVPNVPEPKAFCTVKYHREEWPYWGLKLGQPVFSAVSPEFRGWYLKIISEIHYHLKEIGAEHAFLSTQVTNKAVIRVWEKLGYTFGKTEHVFRVIL